MKPMTLAGVALLVAGLLALACQGITYTSRETVLDIGPIQATADTEKTMPLSPLVGMVAAAAGVSLIVAGTRKRK